MFVNHRNSDWWQPQASVIPEPPRSRIINLRRLLLVHSCIYYEFDSNLVSDHKWQAWGNVLVFLQRQYGHRAGFYDAFFDGWDASTGFHLPFDLSVQNKAQQLLGYHRPNTR